MKYLIYIGLFLFLHSCTETPRKKNKIEIALDKLKPGMSKSEIDSTLPNYIQADWENKVTYESYCSSVYLIFQDTIIKKDKYYIDFCADTLTTLTWSIMY
jgi:hypothetical protein